MDVSLCIKVRVSVCIILFSFDSVSFYYDVYLLDYYLIDLDNGNAMMVSDVFLESE